jgi:diguanylate cyclase (GGDEF)-like protein
MVQLTDMSTIHSSAKELADNGEGPFSVAVMDIDNFKEIIAAHGETIGNEVVKKLETLLLKNLGEEDLVSRKGDEFLILLRRNGAERSFMDMEELRKHLSDNTYMLSDGEREHDVYITFSCGIASFPRDSKSSVELFRVADSAMYRAKKLGKNKVCLSEAENMVLKSSYITKTQADRLGALAKKIEKTEAFLLREALDDLLRKYRK